MISLVGFSICNSPSYAAAASGPSAPLRLDLPLACVVGQNCWVQNYVDRDPSIAAKDYTCGSLTYDKHTGTDFRIPDMAAQQNGVDVLASAAGKVLRTRDGMQDISVRTIGLDAVKGRECGNAVVIDHGGGWGTQYCHMAKGSVVVKPGDMVASGQRLGKVGLSGDTEFPHVHINVTHNGEVVDPFAPDPPQAGSCGGGPSLWIHPPPYRARSAINYGFTGAPIGMADIERGGVAKPLDQSPYLAAYVRAIGLRAGDKVSLQIIGPDGAALAAPTPEVVPKDSAQRFLLVGRKRRQDRWPKGLYTGRYTVSAGDKQVLEQTFSIQMP